MDMIKDMHPIASLWWYRTWMWGTTESFYIGKYVLVMAIIKESHNGGR
jgi:hypothetical protein